MVAESYDTFEKAGKEYKHSAMLMHLQSWKEKPLHSQFLQDVSPQICAKSQWFWLHFSNFSKEMEGIIFATQEQVLSTNAIKTYIYKMSCSATVSVVYVAHQMRP